MTIYYECVNINTSFILWALTYVHPNDRTHYLLTHEPVHWTIRCEWLENRIEILTIGSKDEYLDEQSKSDLIDYFKTKVEEECDFEP